MNNWFMGCFFKQLYHLVADNRLHAVIVIVGTAVTMTFVMMVVMVYDFRTADIAPESDRSRTLYTALGKISAKDGTNIEVWADCRLRLCLPIVPEWRPPHGRGIWEPRRVP